MPMARCRAPAWTNRGGGEGCEYAASLGQCKRAQPVLIILATPARAMKSGASLLLAELVGHVNKDDFETELALAAEAGLATVDRPLVSRCHATVLKKA
jgi:hypothetical protein